MTCHELLDHYSDYRDGRLDEVSAGRVRRHLEACTECARYDRTLREGVRVLQDLTVEPASDFHDRLQHRLYHVEDERRSSGSVSKAPAFLLAAAALAVLAWGPEARLGLEPERREAPAATESGAPVSGIVVRPDPDKGVFGIRAAMLESSVQRPGTVVSTTSEAPWLTPPIVRRDPSPSFVGTGFSPLVVVPPTYTPAEAAGRSE